MNLKYLQLIGTIFTLILGTLLHFTYDWSGENVVASIFSATNESTWEHLKLLAMPTFLFGVIEYFVWGTKTRNFIPVKVLSLVLGMMTIMMIFYTYVGVVGQHFLWADIGVFVMGIIVAYSFSAHFLYTDYFSSAFSIFLGWTGLLLMFASFVLFTFFPPHIGLFLDPVSHSYGR